MDSDEPDRRPTVIAVAGSNGAGKSVFYETQLADLGWHFVNADLLARELGIDAYTAAKVADQHRRDLVKRRVSFVFETVFSDPVGEKVAFLESAVEQGYNVILCFIAIRDPETSIQRVAMRVTQGGHGVPIEKLRARHARTLENLIKTIRRLPQIRIYENTDLSIPYRLVAIFEDGKPTMGPFLLSDWLVELLVPEFFPSD